MYVAALNGFRNQSYTTTKPIRIIILRMVFMRDDNLSPHLGELEGPNLRVLGNFYCVT